MSDIRPILALLEHFDALCNDNEGSAVDHMIAEIRKHNRSYYATEDYFFAHHGVYVFAFGAYGSTYVLATGHVEDALESAAAMLPPGYFTEPEFPANFFDLDEDARDRAYNEACVDLTYTESGYLHSWEWTCTEFDSVYEAAQWLYETSGH